MTLSDSRNKARALSRIKRLASSGLPLDPFVQTVLHLVNDAVPNSPNKALHVGTARSDAYVCNTQEVRGIVDLHNRYFVESSSEISGSRFPFDVQTLKTLLVKKTVWLQPDAFTSHMYRAEGYNEAYRPLGWHHTIAMVFQEMGEYVGYCGVWRSVDQKPFSREDIKFLQIVAPHIAHGLKVASLLEQPVISSGDFLPLPGWHSGVILLDTRGHPVAMDAAARLIFQQLGVLDGCTIDALGAAPVCDGLAYISRRLAEVFRGTDTDSERAAAPVYRIYHHWTGIVLKLRGVQMMSADGPGCNTVLVERGETAEARRRRVSTRWGLSDREAQILSFISNGKTGPEIATLLAISHDTVRKHTTRILDKLGVENRTAAAAVALDSTL